MFCVKKFCTFIGIFFLFIKQGSCTISCTDDCDDVISISAYPGKGGSGGDAGAAGKSGHTPIQFFFSDKAVKNTSICITPFFLSLFYINKFMFHLFFFNEFPSNEFNRNLTRGRIHPLPQAFLVTVLLYD